MLMAPGFDIGSISQINTLLANVTFARLQEGISGKKDTARTLQIPSDGLRTPAHNANAAVDGLRKIPA